MSKLRTFESRGMICCRASDAREIEQQRDVLLKACEAALANMNAISETNRKWTMRDQVTYETLASAIDRARQT